MSQPVDFLRANLAEDVASRARTRLDEGRAAQVERLARHYLAGIPADEMDGVEAEPLFAMLVGLLGFVRERQGGVPKIRVFDPDPETHGWLSPHSVVEIVNDDMPFLVDSVSMVLSRLGIAIHLLVHPILSVKRDKRGVLEELAAAGEGGSASPPHHESVMHMEIDRQDAAGQSRIIATLTDALADVRAAVTDWRAMKTRIKTVAGALGEGEECGEAVEFLDWLHDDHFTFLGYRHFVFSGPAESPKVAVDEDVALGILRAPYTHVFDDKLGLSSMPPEIRAFLARPGVLLVTKSARHSTVHRPVHMDIIGVKHVDSQGRVVGLHAFLGLFTSVAYTRHPSGIPLLRRKVVRVQQRLGFPPHGHDAKALVNILETYPRDELFQIGEDLLTSTARAILHLQERPRVALFARPDEFGRFVSCLVFLPRDRYDTPLRRAAIRLLEQAFGGTLDAYYTQISDGPLARLHVIVRTQPGQAARVDLGDLEARLADAARSWSDHLQDALLAAHGEVRALALGRRWREAFPLSYHERHSALTAVADVERLEAVLAGAEIGLNLYRPVEAAEHECLATFDARRGAVTRIETRDDSEYLQQHSRGVTELVGIEDRGGDWAASFGREADAYFAATEAYDAAHQRATRDAGRSQSLMEGAKAGLEQARRGLDAEIFRGQIDRKLSDHAETAKYAAEEAASRASRIGAAAPEWEAADLDGKVRRLADYRGKVVVLDFWYRGCGWCMHAMPQVARLAETFRDRPVAVLGVSTDKDEKDARAVAKAMGLMHPTIRAGDVDSRYGVESFPTLIVIDKAGKIREFRVGYSPHLYEDLEPLIRELAAERPAG